MHHLAWYAHSFGHYFGQVSPVKGQKRKPEPPAKIIQKRFESFISSVRPNKSENFLVTLLTPSPSLFPRGRGKVRDAAGF
jgi:hypothetical protein